MDDFLLNRMLCEQLRDRSCWVEAESEAQRKKLLNAEIVSLIKRLKRSYIFSVTVFRSRWG